MTSQKIKQAAQKLHRLRTEAELAEDDLAFSVALMISEHKAGLRDWARSMGISAQYACDIRHGRRKISDTIVKRILEGA